jgi:hypothetical protein
VASYLRYDDVSVGDVIKRECNTDATVVTKHNGEFWIEYSDGRHLTISNGLFGEIDKPKFEVDKWYERKIESVKVWLPTVIFVALIDHNEKTVVLFQGSSVNGWSAWVFDDVFDYADQYEERSVERSSDD